MTNTDAIGGRGLGAVGAVGAGVKRGGDSDLEKMEQNTEGHSNDMSCIPEDLAVSIVVVEKNTRLGLFF